MISNSAEITFGFKTIQSRWNTWINNQSVIIRTDAKNVLGYIQKSPCCGTCKPAVLCFTEILCIFTGNHLGVYIRFGAVNLADIFNISRTGSCVYLPCTIASSDNGLCDGNPWVVVTEDTGIFFISWWIRRNFTKLNMVSMVSRLQ